MLETLLLQGRFRLKSFKPKTILSRPELFNQMLDLYRKNGEPDLNVGTFMTRLKSDEF